MADTFTSGMRLRKPEVGANNNTWGGLLNEDALDLIDAALSGRVAITIDTADVTLTSVDGESDQSRAHAFVLSGTLTGNRNLIVPAGPGAKLYVITNNTTGAYNVTFKSAGGTGVVVPQNGAPYLYFYVSDALGVATVRLYRGVFSDQIQTWTAAQTMTPVALTDAATIAIDAALSNSFTVTLGGNRTLGNPTNISEGQIFDVLVTQDGTGGRTLGYASTYRAPVGSFPTITPTAGHASLLTFRRHGAFTLLIGAVLDFTLA